MSFPSEDVEGIYNLVSINIHIVNDIYSGHYFCDLLYYNKETSWNCDDDILTKNSVHLNKVYDNLSKDNEQKRGEILLETDKIRLCQY